MTLPLGDPGGRRRRGLAGWVVAGAALLALVELVVVIAVGRAIGFWPTVGLLVAETVIGGLVVRREGRRAWRQLRAAVAAAGPSVPGARPPSLPGRELADGALVLLGGVLLLLPGFVTDLAGFLLVLPATRPLARRAAGRLLGTRFAAAAAPFPGDGRVIRGEVVEDPPDPGDGPVR